MDFFYGPLVFAPPSLPPVLPLLEISHQSHVGGRPSSPSRWRESEPDNDLGDNNRAEETKERWGRMEGGWQRSGGWWEKCFSLCSSSLLNDYYPQCWWCPFSAPSSYSSEEVPGKMQVIHPAPWGGSGLAAPWWGPPLDGSPPVPLLQLTHYIEKLS